MKNRLYDIQSRPLNFPLRVESSNCEYEDIKYALLDIKKAIKYFSDIKYNDTFVVDKVNLIDNENVQSGKIAPGSLGYFDIVIDPSDTDTAIRYDVTFDFSSLNNKVVVSSIEEVYSGNLIRTDLNTYSKVITLNEIKNGITNTIRVYIKWDNSDDESDSAIGSVINNFINVPVTIAAYQYLGEKIDIYNESTD